jgi:hypothetical protein
MGSKKFAKGLGAALTLSGSGSLGGGGQDMAVTLHRETRTGADDDLSEEYETLPGMDGRSSCSAWGP